jgi:hypothetical protein
VIAQFLNRDVVLNQLRQIEDVTRFDRDKAAAAGEPVDDHDLVLHELDAAAQRETTSSGQSSFNPPADDRRGSGSSVAPPMDDYVFISRDPIVSLLQSALDELYDNPEHAMQVQVDRPASDRRGAEPDSMVTDRSLTHVPVVRAGDDRRYFEQFSVTDARWVRSKLAEGIRLIRRRRAFNANPAKTATLENNSRLVLVGDWGTGLPRARAVAAQMRAAIDEALRDGRRVHVIHLGDVYYSGWGNEYRKRFLPYWPVHPDEAETIGSWTLNGNHDMYSGGHAYYDVALADPRFARWQADDRGSATSYFSIVGSEWQVLALDSSWDDGGLQEPQASWLRDALASAGARKTLVLSHHQLFSAYEHGAKDLGAKIAPVLADHPLTAWFWGHEHRCMWFERHQNVSFGRCLGDGGVPVYQWHGLKDDYPVPGTYECRRFFKRGLERWAVMGFAIFDVNGSSLDVRYIDETGFEHNKETIA